MDAITCPLSEVVLNRRYAVTMEGLTLEVGKQSNKLRKLVDEVKLMRRVQNDQISIGLQAQESETYLLKRIRYLETQLLEKAKD